MKPSHRLFLSPQRLLVPWLVLLALGQLLLLTPAPAVAQPADAAVSSPASGPTRHLLWRVSSDQGTVYLLGSLHMARENLHPLPELIEAAFVQAEVVVFEIELDRVFSATFALVKRGYFWDQRTLESEVSEATWELLQENSEDLPFSLSWMRKAKPWFVALLLTIGQLEEEGFSAQAGIDQYLFQRAKAEEKEIQALETADEQLAFFDAFTREEQDLYLRSLLEGPGEGTEVVDEMVASWEQGDAENLERLLDQGGDVPSVLLDKLLLERNRNWVGPIEELLAEGKRALVVVGAAHLVGEGSVVDLLRRKGYIVRQM